MHSQRSSQKQHDETVTSGSGGQVADSGSRSGSESGSGSGLPVILSSLATSVPVNLPRGMVFEGRRREKLAGERARWMARAIQMGEAGDPVRRKYAANRAAALGRDLRPAVDQCGKRARDMRCGCVGPSRPSREMRMVEFNCRQHLVCDRCSKKRSRRLRARMREGLAFHLEREHAEWKARGCRRGERPQIVLMTLGVRHTGDVQTDRDALSSGWRAFYKALHRRGLAGPYVGVWEATSGRDGLGHVHMHVAIVWPFVDWGLVRELWVASCPESEVIDLKGSKPRRDGRPTTGWSAANYLGKYISKGVSFEGMGEILAADVVAASYNQRLVITSRKFWQPWDRPHCECCGVLPWPDIALRPRTPDEEAAATARERARCLEVLADRYGSERARWLAATVGTSTKLRALADLVEGVLGLGPETKLSRRDASHLDREADELEPQLWLAVG